MLNHVTLHKMVNFRSLGPKIQGFVGRLNILMVTKNISLKVVFETYVPGTCI